MLHGDLIFFYSIVHGLVVRIGLGTFWTLVSPLLGLSSVETARSLSRISSSVTTELEETPWSIVMSHSQPRMLLMMNSEIYCCGHWFRKAICRFCVFLWKK